MKIIEDVKLDFSDVLILPKNNNYSSRSEVSVDRTFTFKYSSYSWTGVPIMVSEAMSPLSSELINDVSITLSKFFEGSKRPK